MNRSFDSQRRTSTRSFDSSMLSTDLMERPTARRFLDDSDLTPSARAERESFLATLMADDQLTDQEVNEIANILFSEAAMYGDVNDTKSSKYMKMISFVLHVN